MSEVLIGRRGRRNPVATMGLLGEEEGSSSHWRLVGLMGVIAGFLILSFYSVIAGWGGGLRVREWIRGLCRRQR